MNIYFDIDEEITYSVRLRYSSAVLANFKSKHEAQIYMKGFSEGKNHRKPKEEDEDKDEDTDFPDLYYCDYTGPCPKRIPRPKEVGGV